MIPPNGHTCDGGNRTLRWSQFCDGTIDCHDRFDEEGHFCKHCINNLYSCPPEDDIRCDLACNMLHYVPCQTIQDRRACNSIRQNYNYSPYQLLKDFNFYITVGIATIIVLLVVTGIIMLIKYLSRMRQRRTFRSLPKTSDLPTAPPPPPPYLSTPRQTHERDTLSSHIYEQCYEPPRYEDAHKYPMTRTYYEHAL